MVTVTTTGDPQAGAMTYTFVSSEMGFESKVVKGFPFSADTLTEFTQTLGNGQRLYRSNTSSLYRDSEGRTRCEQTLGAIGPYVSSSPGQKSIFINDPVAGVSYIINPSEHAATKTATHNPPGMPGTGTTSWVISHNEPGQVNVTSGKVAGESAQSAFTYVTQGAACANTAKIVSHNSSRTEPLGMQMIEGGSAEGTRTIETIPAGAIGNETPIEIISERWYSEELGMVVKTVRNDPLSGNNTCLVKNLKRGEPATDLFQVPADYAIKESVIKFQTIKK